jgi:hypothetical protein
MVHSVLRILYKTSVFRLPEGQERAGKKQCKICFGRTNYLLDFDVKLVLPTNDPEKVS